MGPASTNALQLWGGIECTINRVGEHWSDQAVFSGHDRRGIGDLEAIADLGLRTLRYPVLWEKIAANGFGELRWTETDERLQCLRSRGVEVVAGLLHHGSGPSGTSLVDERFPEKFALYAGAVARRYPWLRDYTPVNEPLTTARFSGLYGIWYPHGRDDATFARALYNQIRGTVLAMRAIRAINPNARLVQTDDLGRASGTRSLGRQVEHENERRWLAFDLLLGRVTPQHALYDFLTGPGELTVVELQWLQENPCPPAIIGVNHYIRSNRFLDEETALYPSRYPRGRIDGVEYVDVAASESSRAESASVEGVLQEVWERYPGVAFAVTEVHIDGDEVRREWWLREVWRAAAALRRRGAPLIAVTAWSLLGTFDWSSLCTTPPGSPLHYEPGVFALKGGELQQTSIAHVLRGLLAEARAEDAAAGGPSDQCRRAVERALR